MGIDLKISAIIPAYNCVKYIKRSINSVLNQKFKPFEVIVVDDGSTDGTAEAISLFGERVTYIYKENGGVASARNIGIEKASCDWIAFLDSDDEWTSEHLENFAKTVYQKPDLMWYGAPIKQINEADNKILFAYKRRRIKNFINNLYFKDYLSALPPSGFFSSSTMVINKIVFRKVGSFERTRFTGEDIDMWFRIGLEYPEVGYSKEMGAVVYRRQDSLSRSNKYKPEQILSKLVDLEDYARKLGNVYASRAEPRIIYRVKKLLRAAISKFDYVTIMKVREKYYPRLPTEYKVLIIIIKLFPGITKLLKVLR